MGRYTTPVDMLTVRGVDLTACSVYVTYKQGRTLLTVDEPTVTYDGTDTTIEVPLTQRQTARFRIGTVRVQVNWLDGYGHRDATVVKDVEVTEQLLEEIVDGA